MKVINLTDWLKSNIFSIINLVVILVGFGYQYGSVTGKITSIDQRMTVAEKKIEDQELYGHPDHERRIAALEKKTDDFSSVRSIVQTQSDQINKLADIVSKDHDVIIKIIGTFEANNKNNKNQ